MVRREILTIFRDNKLKKIFLIGQMTLFFVLVGTFLAFSNKTHLGKTAIEKFYHEKAIYHILDGYLDPDDFVAVREQKDVLDQLKAFYNGLNSAKSFNYLAMYNQSIYVDDLLNRFPDAPTFQENGTWKRIESFQVNNCAVEYFDMSVSEGRCFEKKDFDGMAEEIPVLIGQRFNHMIGVGDRINAQYYQKDITLVVIGVLEENTFVYFNGNSEFYLDGYIVMPYVDYDPPESETEEWFQEIVYFAMINGYLSTAVSEDAENDMMMEVEAISQQTGFNNYLFVGSNPNVQKYRGLINIINENHKLVVALFMLFFFANILTISFGLLQMQSKRLPSLTVFYLNGATKFDLCTCCFLEVLCLAIVSGAISIFILDVLLKIIKFETILVLCGVALGFAAIASVVPEYTLKKVELTSILNDGENVL